MKSTSKFLIITFTFLALTASAFAQSPREELQQMVKQLQQTPNDNALREKIIGLAQAVKPALAVPDEALRHEGRGATAFKNANDVSGFIDAAREFEAASLVAPWVSGYYSDMCTAYEKGGALAEAVRACRLYSLAVTDGKERHAAKLRTAGIEYEAEKHSETALRKLNQSKKPFGNIAGLPSGKRYFCNNYNFQSGKDVFRLGSNAPEPYGRREIWLIKDGAKASAVVVLWVSTESFSELMKAGVIVKNPLIREFPGAPENNQGHPTYSTSLAIAPLIQFHNDGSLAITMDYAAGLGRPASLSSVCDPLE